MFTEKERQVYKFAAPDGSTRFADPLDLYRKLLIAFGGSFQAYDQSLPPREGQELDPDGEVQRAQAEEKVVAAVRGVLQLKPVDPLTGEGATDQQCLDVIDDFMRYLAEKKKSTAS